mgnify:CR=1 FL=1
MKKRIFSLLLCLLSVPVTGFAAETDEEQVKYEDATADNMKEMLKGSIALDKISAENKESLLNWLEAENKPEEAKKLVDKIQKLQDELSRSGKPLHRMRRLQEMNGWFDLYLKGEKSEC